MSGTDVRQLHDGAVKLVEFNGHDPRERLVAYWTGESRWVIQFEEYVNETWKSIASIGSLNSDGTIDTDEHGPVVER